MPRASVNGVQLHYQLSGAQGIPLVLVHGSWDSHHDWDLLVPRLTPRHRVLAYDRRGHSQSQRPAGQGSVREDVADLAALVEHLELAPAWIVGNSFGAAIALRLATERPDLCRGVIGHEPPLFGVLADDPSLSPMLDEINRKLETVLTLIESGDHAAAAEQFAETIALGRGSWVQLPEEARRTLIENAPTFLDECRDPDQLVFDPLRLRDFTKPLLLTRGDQSPPAFSPVVDALARALPRLQVKTIAGAGHIPHVTHPEVYADEVLAGVSAHGD